MPWTNPQVRLFAAAAHDPDIAAKHHMSMDKARGMEMEASPAQRSQAMKGMGHARAKALKRSANSMAPGGPGVVGM